MQDVKAGSSGLKYGGETLKGVKGKGFDFCVSDPGTPLQRF